MAHLTRKELLERNQRQIELALGDDNMWFASEKLGRPATRAEAILHFCTAGGATWLYAKMKEEARLRLEACPGRE